MPKWISAIFVFFLSTMLLNAKAITVEDVISKHIAAMAEQSSKLDKPVEAIFISPAIANTNALKLDGIAQKNGKACYQLSASLVNGDRVVYLIDAKSWYLISKTVIVKERSRAESANKNENKGAAAGIREKAKEGFPPPGE